MTQATAQSLRELAERVERATGPDRDLDWRIQRALGIGRWPDIAIWPPFMVGSKADKEIPTYTASLDAAMSLYIVVPQRIPASAPLAAAEALRQHAEKLG